MQPPRHATPPRNLVLTWIALAVLVSFLGWSWDRISHRSAIDQVEGLVTALAADRVASVEAWVYDQFSEARLLAYYPVVRSLTGVPTYEDDELSSHVSDLPLHARDVLEVTRQVRGLAGAYVLDAEGRILVSSTSDERLDRLAERIAGIVLSQQEPWIQIAPDPGGVQRALVGVPIMGSDGKVAGIVFIAPDPADELYPHLLVDFQQYASLEAVLVRQEGEGVLYLSPRRFESSLMSGAHYPGLSPEFSGAAAVMSDSLFGAFSGYRDVPVYSAARKVPGHDWAVLVEIDRSEALAPWIAGRLTTLFATVSLLLALVGLSYGLWLSVRSGQLQRIAEGEQRFRLLFHSSPLPMMVFDREDQEIIEVNDAAVVKYGYGREEFLKLRVTDIRPREDVQEFLDLLEVSEAAPRVPYQGVHLLRDGTRIDVDVMAHDIDYSDRPARLAVIMDVSDRRQTELENRRLEEQLRQAQKMEAVGRLAGGIAHDFNNMLTVISGNIMLALSGIPDVDPLHERLQKVLKAAHHAEDLTSQLLAFSRKQLISPQVLDLADEIRGVESMLQRVIGEDIEMVTDLEEDLPPIRMDPGQIHQILMNLITNAREAMPRGGRLTLKTRRLKVQEADNETPAFLRRGDYVVLEVEDTGDGISAEDLDQVFEPFFTTKDTGTGLGLATVYGIIKQNEGFIDVRSTEGEGTDFLIYFPIHTPASSDETSPEDGVPVEGRAGAGQRLLVVEDEEAVRALTVEILTMAGYQVTACEGPLEAEELFAGSAADFELVITDVVMPGRSGVEMAERLWAIRPDLRVLFVSGYTDDKVLAAGADPDMPLLTKPFKTADLLKMVEGLLGDPA